MGCYEYKDENKYFKCFDNIKDTLIILSLFLRFRNKVLYDH